MAKTKKALTTSDVKTLVNVNGEFITYNGGQICQRQ